MMLDDNNAPTANGHHRDNETDSLVPNSATVFHRTLLDLPERVTHASGIYMHLESGSTFLDATGGPSVSCLGHGHPTINAAIISQLNQVSYVGTAFYSTTPAEELCTLLIAGTNNAMSRAYICNSGSEANEAMLKMVRQYFVELEGLGTKRERFIARRQSYHGNTLGALGLSGHVARRKFFKPMLNPSVSHVSPCYAYRDQRKNESMEDYVERLAKELEDEILRLGPETVCAFVAEPVVGAALGCVPSVPGYFKAMRAVCDKYGVLLVFDEVMSGMGRCGTLHAWQSEVVDAVPDLQALGKGLGGGYQPVAALLANQKVVDVLTRGTGVFTHGHTYQAHPLACAAAVAVQKIVAKPETLENVRNMGALLERGLRARLEDKWYIGDIRGRGLFWGIEFVKDKATKEPFDAKLAVGMGVHKLGQKQPHMVALYPGAGTADGASGDHIIVSPAYIVTEEEINLIVDRVAACIEAYFDEHFPTPAKSQLLTEGDKVLHDPAQGSMLAVS